MHKSFKHYTSTLQLTRTSLQRNPVCTLRRFQYHTAKMPLVVPGVTADNMDGDKAQEWMNKLVGKTISEEPSTETVCQRLSGLSVLSGTLADLCP